MLLLGKWCLKDNRQFHGLSPWLGVGSQGQASRAPAEPPWGYASSPEGSHESTPTSPAIWKRGDSCLPHRVLQSCVDVCTVL